MDCLESAWHSVLIGCTLLVVKGKKSAPFEITSGVRQGDSIAPVLFNLALDQSD
jgi:hypothetical protein